jgi:hypothetical protein
MKIKALTNGVGVSADSRTHVAMRAHVPMQTDMPPQMMNSAVPPTIQSAVEKRRIGSTQRSLVTFKLARGDEPFSGLSLPLDWASGGVELSRVRVMRRPPEGLPAKSHEVVLAP